MPRYVVEASRWVRTWRLYETEFEVEAETREAAEEEARSRADDSWYTEDPTHFSWKVTSEDAESGDYEIEITEVPEDGGGADEGERPGEAGA